MMIINSTNLPALMDAKVLDKDHLHWAYNGLDSAVTLKVWQELSALTAASPHATTAYAHHRSLQGPALAMMGVGCAIQQGVRQDETARYLALQQKAQALLDTLANAVWGPELYTETIKTKVLHQPTGVRGQLLAPRWRTEATSEAKERPRGLNASSAKQTIAFFTLALGLPPQYAIRKTAHGTERTPSADDKALAFWAKIKTKGPGVLSHDRSVPSIHLAAPFVSLILTIRDCVKMLSVLRTPLDPDGRMRCSYNIAGTKIDRWSSSKNVYGRGTNLQNQTESMRRMFCADDGQMMFSTDLEQAESRVTAGEVWASTGDSSLWDACHGPDLHTTVVRMCYPELAWTNDPTSNRAIAELPCPDILSYSYRDVAKRVGHGSNYGGSPFGISKAVGLPVHVVENFQRRYYSAFPGMGRWHADIRARLKADRYIDTPLGHRRWFFDRPWEDSTFRQAVAYVPESVVGVVLNRVLRQCWLRSLLPSTDPAHIPITLLLQNHDAFVFQLPLTSPIPSHITSINAEFNAVTIPFSHGSARRVLTIPGEFVSGYNWSKIDPKHKHFKDGNPDGLAKWGGSDPRTRIQSARTSAADWIARPISSLY